MTYKEICRGGWRMRSTRWNVEDKCYYIIEEDSPIPRVWRNSVARPDNWQQIEPLIVAAMVEEDGLKKIYGL